MSKALRNVNTHKVPQIEQASPKQVRNNAGGFSFKVDDWNRLERFLIIGTDGGTYYTKERDLTKQNVDFVRELLKQDAYEVIRRTVDVSVNARAKSNSQALFVLALAMNTEGVDKAVVRSAVAQVARTSTHLFEWSEYVKNLGGWGPSKRKAVINWYESKSDQQLGLQLVKYRQRNGWTHRDMLRIAHPKNINSELANFALGKEYNVDGVPPIVVGFEKAQRAQTEQEIISLINNYGLPWEAIPTEWHKSLKVWRAIYEAGMGQTALVRNVTRFAKLDAFDDMKFAADYASKLADPAAIAKGKMHPIQYLNAAVVYEEGQLNRRGWSYDVSRNKDWKTNGKVLKALQEGFYAAFKNVEPAGKSTLVALDVSGSMSWTASSGLDLTCAQVGAAVAMQIARTEPASDILGFSHQLVDLGITENDTLGTAMKKINKVNMGGTDCAIPMLYAQERKLEIETFVVVTDNETWFGDIHPYQALKDYRKTRVANARLAVLGVAGNEFTIADPEDAGMMDFVGFDSNAPKVLADFSAGRL